MREGRRQPNRDRLVPNRGMTWLVLLPALILLVSTPGCRKLLTGPKLEEFRRAATAAVQWEILGRESGPDLYTGTIERFMESAGLEMVDAGTGSPDLVVHIELRGSYTYETPKPGDWWDSGEVSLIGPEGRLYFKHFYGDDVDAPTSFYAEYKGFYEHFLLMTSRIWGRRVAEAEVKALAGDPRFSHVPGRILARLDGERAR